MNNRDITPEVQLLLERFNALAAAFLTLLERQAELTAMITQNIELCDQASRALERLAQRVANEPDFELPEDSADWWKHGPNDD